MLTSGTPSTPTPYPFVSVILPTYNRAESLGRAIDSVLSQAPPPDELIVVDDGSEVDLSSVLAPYAGRIIVHRQANGGVSSARNAGARMARGTWLAFIDSDDEWTPNHMAVLYRDLKDAPKDVVAHLGNVRYKGRGYDAVYFALKGVDFPIENGVRPERLVPLIASSMIVQGSAIRRDTFNSLSGFEQNMRIGEDTHMFARLASKGAFLVTGTIIAIIHRLDNDQHSLSRLERQDPVLWWTLTLRTLDPFDALNLSQDERRHVASLRHTLLLRLAKATAENGTSRPWSVLIRLAQEHPSPTKGWAKALVLGILGKRGYGLFLNTPPLIDRS